MNVRVFAVLLLACAACGARSDVVHPGGTARASKRAPVGPAARDAPARALNVQIAFAAGRLHVRVAATGSPDDVRFWNLGQSAVERLEVRDANERGVPFAIEGKVLDTGGGQTTIVVSYDVVAPPGPPPVTFETADTAPSTVHIDEDATALQLEPSRFRAVGEDIVAVPAQLERKPLPIALDVRASDGALVATSFGIAKDRVTRTLQISAGTLRRGAFLAGPGGRAEFDAPEGHDEAAWLGYPAFDPRAVSAEVAGFRGFLHEYFKDYDLEPATLFFAVDARPRGHFRVLRRASGVLVTLGSDPYDASMRVWVAHELVHAWIGERVWLGEIDQVRPREAETSWFHEGVTRWIAREQLSRAGLLVSDEYAHEVNRLLAIVATSRHASRPLKDLAADRAVTGVAALLVARGALLATLEDARIREASHGARSFDDVVRGLATLAGERRGPLPESAPYDAVVAELGEARAKEDFDDVLTFGRRTRLPDNALGPCFESREVAYDVYDAGFDVVASRAAHAIVGVDPKGPAALAGLRDRDVLVSVEVPERAEQTAKIEVERSGKRVVVSYRPTSGTKRGQGFRRKPALTEEACKKLALRR
ncbi:MAG: hypothetical protein JWP87_2236 [Labilithrix sp.]|nr:hypothetical protein [Labilithrix sp.]